MTQSFKQGDRVISTFDGLYSGLPRTIIMRSVIQQENNESRYIIELDIGKRIVLWAANIDYYSYPQDINS